MPTHYRGSEATVRALNAFITLMRASDSLVARLGAKLEIEGVTSAQFGILEAVYHLGPMCQKTLAEKLLRSGGNTTVVLNNLEKRGLVERRRHAQDRRKVEIHLTPGGLALIASVFPRHAEQIASELSVLAPEDQETLRGICRKLGKAAKNSSQKRGEEENKNAQDSTK
jgi:MarR family transcriptional regulator, 2-MHQ and catechol-resistance regulon repressor